MKNSPKLKDEELIDFVYEIAANHLCNKNTDLSDWKKWKRTIIELEEPIRYTYYIGILNMQIMNGGFMQYYDNDYGIFARETMVALEIIDAKLTSNLVSQSIKILNKHKNIKTDFDQFITDKKYWNIDEIETVFSDLDSEYYNLENKENLGKIVADYLRKKKQF